MAVGIQNYPNITPADSDYPNGSLKDKNGSSHGTPLNKLVYNDIHTLLDKILREAEVEANGLPDSEYVGNQYYQALLMNCFNRVGAPIITGLIGSYTEDDLIVLYGVTVSVVSNTATWTEGYIFYNGNIYFVPAGSDTKSPGDTFFYTITSDMMFEIGISHGAPGDGIADYGAGTVKRKSYTYSTGGGGDYIALDNRTVIANFVYNSGNKTAGQTLYTIPSQFRTSAARTIGISFVTYQAGAGAGQQGNCIPGLLNTNTGVITTTQDMATNHDTISGGFSYLLD